MTRRPRARLAALAVLLTAITGCVSSRSDSRDADARIGAEVRSLFAQHPALGAPNAIDVQVVERVVYLRGIVNTPYEIELAGEIAGQARGVDKVVDLISLDNAR